MDPKRKAFRLPWFQFKSEYFLFLLPVFFVVHGYTDHYGDIPAKDAFYLGMEYTGYIMLTCLLLALALRSVRKAAVLTFFFFVFFFFFGAAHDWLKVNASGSFLVSYSFILPATVAVFSVLFFYFKKTANEFKRLTRYLNTLLIILLVVDGIGLTLKPANGSTLAIQNTVASARTPAPESLCDTCKGEDIHLIITDEYAGSKSLKEVLHFDNTPFIDSLRRRGFHVVENPRSNYNYTVASMASFFSMDYLPELEHKSDEEVYRLSKGLIGKNAFTDFLASRGYTIKNYSIFEFAGQAPFAEPYFPQQIKLITGNTFLGRAKMDIGYHAALTLRLPWELEKVKKQLMWDAKAEERKMDSVLKEVAAPHRAPRFFYTHLLMPHRPYLLDRDENLLRLESLLNAGKDFNDKEYYLKYLHYTNNKLLSFIDEIHKRSAAPPVILLLSDHGLRRHWVPVSYHFSNISAVFLPDGGVKDFYPGITNVNQLRTLLKLKFRHNLPLLSDSSIFLGIKGLY